MPIPEPYDDEKTVGTPAWWLKRLGKALDDRAPALRLYDDYYSDKHRLAFATEKFRQRFGNLFAPFADNFCAIVVDAPVERLRPQGFRIPEPGSSSEEPPRRRVPLLREETGDKDAWDMWQRNSLDLYSQVGHTEAHVEGEAYALCWWDNEGNPKITIEHPLEMIAETDAEDPIQVRAALKRWLDDSGFMLATLYLTDAIFKFRSDRAVYVRDGTPQLAQAARWEPREVVDEEWPLSNRLNQVPVVPLRNSPRLRALATSEIKTIIPTQDAINKIWADMLIASEHQSFRQRIVTGIEIPRDPQTNEILDDFYKQVLEKIWFFEGDNAKAFELGQVDLSGYVRALELAVDHIAARTRTPPHYFQRPGGAFPSGESLKAAETGLVAKVRRKQIFYGEAWEHVIRLGFAIKGDPRAEVFNSETIWADPETRSESEHTDAVMKQQALGIPRRALWEKLGYSPQEIERFLAWLEAEAAQQPAQLVLADAGGGANGNQ